MTDDRRQMSMENAVAIAHLIQARAHLRGWWHDKLSKPDADAQVVVFQDISVGEPAGYGDDYTAVVILETWNGKLVVATEVAEVMFISAIGFVEARLRELGVVIEEPPAQEPEKWPGEAPAEDELA